MFLRFWLDLRGATALEYGIVAGLISMAVIAGATGIGNKIVVDYLIPASNGLR